MYYAVQDNLRSEDPIFTQMSDLALEKYYSNEPLKVVTVKNVFDDHHQGKKYHLIFTAGPANCQDVCIPKFECGMTLTLQLATNCIVHLKSATLVADNWAII